MLETAMQIIGRRATDCYKRQFKQSPRWLVAAPGRVNLIGEHTDYNGGFVLPMAIDRCVAIAAGPAKGGNIATLYSGELDETASFELQQPITVGEPKWTNYVRGVIAGAQQRGVDIPAFNAAIDSNVPIGGGLSSSAALEVATAMLIEAMSGHCFEPVDKILLCQRAEHDYASMPCGIMDQYISVMGRPGHALLIDCRSNEATQVAMDDSDMAVLIANTNVKHELTGSEYSQRRTQCSLAAKTLGVELLRDADMADLEAVKGQLDKTIYRRARHVISEIARTTEAAKAFEQRGWPKAGELMYASHDSLRNDYEVSCDELDLMVDLAHEIGLDGGVYGARMTGGGFGGCTVWLIQTEATDRITKHLCDHYRQRIGVEPSVFTTAPVAGAAVIDL